MTATKPARKMGRFVAREWVKKPRKPDRYGGTPPYFAVGHIGEGWWTTDDSNGTSFGSGTKKECQKLSRLMNAGKAKVVPE